MRPGSSRGKSPRPPARQVGGSSPHRTRHNARSTRTSSTPRTTDALRSLNSTGSVNVQQMIKISGCPSFRIRAALSMYSVRPAVSRVEDRLGTPDAEPRKGIMPGSEGGNLGSTTEPLRHNNRPPTPPGGPLRAPVTQADIRHAANPHGQTATPSTLCTQRRPSPPSRARQRLAFHAPAGPNCGTPPTRRKFGRGPLIVWIVVDEFLRTNPGFPLSSGRSIPPPRSETPATRRTQEIDLHAAFSQAVSEA